jgi:hypothetical protein
MSMPNGLELKGLEGTVLGSLQICIMKLNDLVAIKANHVVVVLIIEGGLVKGNPALVLKGLGQETCLAEGGDTPIDRCRTDLRMA